jgi:hypothetical protein
MNTSAFLQDVEPLTKRRARFLLLRKYLRRLRLLRDADPCPDVAGMTCERKLRLLNRAVSFLPEDRAECYLEVGSYQGKSLISALLRCPGRFAVACDNFSLFDDPVSPRNKAALLNNLSRYQLSDQVRFFDCDFRELLANWRREGLPSVGVYFYDGAHDEESQYLGIRLAEPLLADQALVIVDDWRYAEDSRSFAEKGTKRAIEESPNRWRIEHVLPARYNGDPDQWWNGLAVLTFQRA